MYIYIYIYTRILTHTRRNCPGTTLRSHSVHTIYMYMIYTYAADAVDLLRGAIQWHKKWRHCCLHLRQRPDEPHVSTNLFPPAIYFRWLHSVLV